MKILIISIYYWPEPVPKPHELAEGLADRGHEVTVLTGFPHYPIGRIYDGYALRPTSTEHVRGVRVVRVPVYPDHTASTVKRAAQALSFPTSALMAGMWLARGADVVYVWGNPPTSGLSGWLVSRLHRGAFVYGVHDLWPDLAVESGMLNSPFAIRALDWLERFVLRRADAVISISDGIKDAMVRRGCPNGKVEVIPHWADERLYRPMAPDMELKAFLGLAGKRVVMYAGNVGRLQNLENLVMASSVVWHDHPDLHVVIVGDGVERERLRELVQRRSIGNVSFVDRVPAEEVVRYLCLSDALYVSLLDSPLAALSVPSKLPTYLACGRPVLSSVSGETDRIVREEDVGVACCDGTVDGIAAGLLAIARTSPEALKAMGARAHRLFEKRFRMSVLLRRHEELFFGAL